MVQPRRFQFGLRTLFVLMSLTAILIYCGVRYLAIPILGGDLPTGDVAAICNVLDSDLMVSNKAVQTIVVEDDDKVRVFMAAAPNGYGQLVRLEKNEGEWKVTRYSVWHD